VDYILVCDSAEIKAVLEQDIDCTVYDKIEIVSTTSVGDTAGAIAV
jgi:hypothetical protein